MTVTRYLTEAELIERALTVLMEALGPVEALRFLNLPRERRLESVERHRQWQASLNQAQFFDQVFGAMDAEG